MVPRCLATVEVRHQTEMVMAMAMAAPVMDSAMVWVTDLAKDQVMDLALGSAMATD